jgi:hypothetical protein
MYNLVTFGGDMYTIFALVFDARGNEIWHDHNYSDLLIPRLNRLRFPFSNAIHDHHTAYAVVREVDNVVDFVPIEEIELLDPIANESVTGFGYGRLVHRSFLNQSKTV